MPIQDFATLHPGYACFKEKIIVEGQKYSEIEIFGEAMRLIKRALTVLKG